ncbi:MAG: bifunctional 4-hydroxy-2-oxoglutarate aldolase/2-dehydro-3-deoxy-phosphogluconate aldolase [Elusimicrobiota bacterium]
MDKQQCLEIVTSTGIVAVVRVDDAKKVNNIADALLAGGVKCIEITLTVPGAIDVIKILAKEYSDKAVIGAGTVLDAETARMAILAGADYIVSPVLKLDVIAMCRRYSKAVVPAGITPTEILTAWEAGADIVKVFPATSLGPQFFKDVLAPLPYVKMLPTGGVSLETAGKFIQAGAVAVAAGSNLVNKKLVAENKWDEITVLAKKYIDAVKSAREGI